MRKKFEILVNSGMFKDRVVSPYSIKEVINYVEKQTKLGENEFFTLINNESNLYIQVVFNKNGFLVQVPISIGNDKVKLVEKANLSKKDTVSLFCKFLEGKEIDTSKFEDVQFVTGKNEFRLDK